MHRLAQQSGGKWNGVARDVFSAVLLVRNGYDIGASCTELFLQNQVETQCLTFYKQNAKY